MHIKFCYIFVMVALISSSSCSKNIKKISKINFNGEDSIELTYINDQWVSDKLDSQKVVSDKNKIIHNKIHYDTHADYFYDKKDRLAKVVEKRYVGRNYSLLFVTHTYQYIYEDNRLSEILFDEKCDSTLGYCQNRSEKYQIFYKNLEYNNPVFLYFMYNAELPVYLPFDHSKYYIQSYTIFDKILKTSSVDIARIYNFKYEYKNSCITKMTVDNERGKNSYNLFFSYLDN